VTPEPTAVPRDDDGLTDLHFRTAQDLLSGVERLGPVLTLTFGEEAATTALRALLVDSCHIGRSRTEQRAFFDRLGWRAYLDEDGINDAVFLTQDWRDAAAYAGQGIAPDEAPGTPPSEEDRIRRIEELAARARVMLEGGDALFPNGNFDVWKGVLARHAIDFGGTVTVEGIQILSGLTLSAIRSAISLGQLNPDDNGSIASEEAKAWLGRRREFCPSRWTNLEDAGGVYSGSKAGEPDEHGMIYVPQDRDGVPFTPEHVVRAARSRPGLSITVGAKGEEEQYRDFYEALAALARMDVARWRRPNEFGNWGTVRARGAWVAVSKAEVDRQLAAKTAEAA
jgi:hypothetical protein